MQPCPGRTPGHRWPGPTARATGLCPEVLPPYYGRSTPADYPPGQVPPAVRRSWRPVSRASRATTTPPARGRTLMSHISGARPAGTRTQDPGPGPIGLLGRACYRHRWTTLFVWLAGVACLITLWTRFGAPAQDNSSGSDPGQSLLNKHFPHASGDSLTLAIDSRAPLSDPAARARIETALVPFERAAHVTSVTDPYRAPGHISTGGHIAFATVQFDVVSTKISTAEAKALMADATAASGHGMTFSLGGDVVDLAETPYGGPSDGIAVLAAAAVLLIAFGSCLATGLQ